MIDSHCHLADQKFDADRADVLERARAAGVSHCITIGDSLQESEQCVALATQYPELFATVGIHPHNAKRWQEGDDQRLMSMARSSSRVKAIGEIGLDYHYDHSPRDMQKNVFGTQLEVAKELNLPAVVHCRNAPSGSKPGEGSAILDVNAIVAEVQPPKIVIHCCTEYWIDVQPLVEQGHFLSFTGIATYPTATTIRQTIERCPISQMMIETDAPYLAPVPHRGKRNEPAYVVEVAKLIAKIKGMSLAEVDSIVTQNTIDFFGLERL